MRNFDERMDEIRRRAEMLRRRRRQRMSAAVCCVTGAACLCLVLWNPVVLGPTKQALPEAGSGENAFYSAAECAVTELRVSAMGEETVITDTEKILHFLLIADPDAAGAIKENSASRETVPDDSCDLPGGTRGEHTFPAAGGKGEDDATVSAEDTLENSGGAASEADKDNRTDGILADETDLSCTVRLILENGEEKMFLLTDTGLVDPETGAVTSLDGNQRQILTELLGLG